MLRGFGSASKRDMILTLEPLCSIASSYITARLKKREPEHRLRRSVGWSGKLWDPISSLILLPKRGPVS